MKQGIVIFSGYNQRAIIAFMRVMEKYKNINYHIVASSNDDPVFLTIYSKHVYCTRCNKALDYDELADILCNLRRTESYDRIIVAPSTEALNRFFLDKCEAFANINVFMPIVDKQLYEEISDKNRFWNLCKEHSIAVPEKMDIPQKFTEKFVAKPKTYISADGKIYSPILVTNVEEFNRFRINYDVSMFDIQEYVEGKSYYLLYYFDFNGTCLKYSQKNIAQQPGGKSILIAESADLHNKEIATKFEKLLVEKKYRGHIMIELRECEGVYYMIEANPRFWGPSQLYVDAGILFFDYFLRDCRLIDKVIEEPCQVAKYMWSTGFQGGIISDTEAVWYENEKETIGREIDEWLKWDIYKRDDTIAVYELEKA